ncbi:hypothetical protein [Curtobacterium flaccumfaciens]|uniref:hypothetical protein n=1 Tax=Curtobacterium flaccumfaciens TaxID=2035 RepID=UPI001E63D5B6|nr:hypothetical protein [Curtobacterium allii]MCE0458441.1 hypothetical protein [Curtobacterium allii]
MTEFVEAGDFSVDAEARTVKGLLLPWGETSRLSASQTPPIAFERGSVKVPADVSVVGANRNHDRYDPVGRATSIEDTDKGLVASFSIAKTDEGDDFLAQYKAGSIRKLSAELTGIVRNGARGVAARLTGAGFVSEGAFASAALFAIGEPEEVPADAQSVVREVPENAEKPLGLEDGDTTFVTATDESGVTTSTTKTVGDPEADEAGATTQKTTTTDVVVTPPAKPEDTPEGAAVPNATVPTTMNAAAATAPKEADASAVFAALSASLKNGDPNAESMLAALADIKTSGSGALPVAGVIQPAWLGEVWAERTYTRKYFGLVKNGSLTNQDEKGFLMDTAAELVQPYSGNKADVPTGTATTSLVSSVFQRWATAVDIAREFFDIPGNNEVIEAFVKRMFNSYARVTDKWALQQIVAGAGTVVPADTYPTGYSAALGKLIQAIDMVDDSDVDTSFVVVAPDVYTALRYTPKDQIPEFVTFSAGRQEGTADGIQVLRDKFGVLAAGQVLAGGHDAAHVNELGGGSPLTIDALDIARGGIDKAVHGYTQYLTEYQDGLVLLGNKTA